MAVARALGVDPSEILDLSASLNPVAPPAAPILRRHLDSVTRYPDPTDATLALARALEVDVDRVLLTNGGAEAIAILAAECPQGWVDEPDFALYARHLATLHPGAPRWRSNPHSPSGRLAPAEEHAAVWDEAFYPLATGRWTRGDADGGGSTVIGSLTKLFACPGMRIGYVLGAPGLVERLRRRQPRWSVAGLACAAVPELLDRVDLPAWSAATAARRDDLVAVLRSAGLAPQAHDGCWVLVPDAGDLRARLLRHRVLVRDCGSFGMPGTVRIGVPGEEGLDRLSRCLDLG